MPGFYVFAVFLLLAGWSATTDRAKAQSLNPQTHAPVQFLSAHDQDLYQQIFTLQDQGDWDKADQLIARLQNQMLIGHVKFQRYMHPTAYRSKYSELYDWLLHYADHPGAQRIWKLANRRQTPGAPPPTLPASPQVPADWQAIDPEKKEKTPRKANAAPAYSGSVRREMRTLRRMVQGGYPTNALKRLNSSTNMRRFSDEARAESLGTIARGYYRYARDQKAMKQAADATALDPKRAVAARWWGGLAAWRQKQYDQAARWFDGMARTESAKKDGLQAAAAFWASRAWLRAGKPQNVRPVLATIDPDDRSFYGFLAQAALGTRPQFNWDLPPPRQLDDFLTLPAIKRAIALTQIEEAALALGEIKPLLSLLPPEKLQDMAWLVDQAGMAGVSMQLAGRFPDLLKKPRPDALSYPVPRWQPNSGYLVDPALLFAMARQESRFQPKARSRSGARGILQLMPATARYIARLNPQPDQILPLERTQRSTTDRAIEDTGRNLELGQRYLAYLLGKEDIAGNLFFTLVGYNAGPGNLAKWQNSYEYDEDPLLFIETIPSRETREYVEHVLVNLWIYRLRLGQGTPSLERLLSGDWPMYVGVKSAKGLTSAGYDLPYNTIDAEVLPQIKTLN